MVRPQRVSARLRRRGPRSFDAIARRSRRLPAENSLHAKGSGLRNSRLPLPSETFRILHINSRGFVSHQIELEAYIDSLPAKPGIICLNETFLDKAVQSPTLEGYVVIARKDRDSFGGGVLVFIQKTLASLAATVLISEKAERVWIILHTDQGPVLLCVWYRPPGRECNFLEALEEEWRELAHLAIGTLIVGDLNVHHLHWLKFSSHTSPAGSGLFRFCAEHGFAQYVKKPTRDKHLLDLVISDMHSYLKAEVLPEFSDHNGVLVTMSLNMHAEETVPRIYWQYSKANWKNLKETLSLVDWSFVDELMPSQATEKFVEVVMSAARKHIPRKTVQELKSTHPWLTAECKSLIRRKHAAQGTEQFAAEAKHCSEGLLREYSAFVARKKNELKRCANGSRLWWKLAHTIMRRAEKCCSIPSLRDEAGEWVTSASAKAELFAKTFAEKVKLPEPVINAFSDIGETSERMGGCFLLRRRTACKILGQLSQHSGTGPDELPALILKECASTLSLPFAKLARRIISCGEWPSCWRVHWICPIHKKKSVTVPGNYRGVHLTAQLSKAMERYIGKLFLPFLGKTLAYGPNQFAYTQERGARDAIFFMVHNWIWLLCHGRKIALYCSDVAGAFDRVKTKRLLEKLRAKGVHEQILRVLASWLKTRRANVVVGGSRSASQNLDDMVYQGTVWGPSLWNCFYEDARKAINENGFIEVVFANDSNPFRGFDEDVPNSCLQEALSDCRTDLHEWGRANCVTFDPSKVSLHIISRRVPWGNSFKILGIEFDTKLVMREAVHHCAVEAGWRITSVLRPRRYFKDAELMKLYKTHVLSHIEYRTSGIAHACESVLLEIDRLQTRFLRELGISEIEALMHFNLAPLAVRRQIAILGVIHRCVLKKGPDHFNDWFRATEVHAHYRTRMSTHYHDKRVAVHLATHQPDLFRRSAFGAAPIYNVLPQWVVSAKSVHDFQKHLQKIVRIRAAIGRDDWVQSLCWTQPFHRHPLNLDHSLLN